MQASHFGYLNSRFPGSPSTSGATRKQPVVLDRIGNPACAVLLRGILTILVVQRDASQNF